MPESMFCFRLSRSSRGLQISHPIPPTLTGFSSSATPSLINFDFHHHLEHQSMPDPSMGCGQSNCTITNNPLLRSMTPSGSSSMGGDVPSLDPKSAMSLPYVPHSGSTTSMTSSTTINSGAGPSSIATGHHRYVKNKLAQPKFPRTPFVKKHSNALTVPPGGNDLHKMI